MLDSRRHSDLLAVPLLAALAALPACGSRALLVVEPCSDGGAIPCPATPNVTLAVGLVGLWHFNDGAGLMAHDSSGNGNHGVLKELDPATAWVTGHEGDGGGLRIGGMGYVEVPLSPSIAAISNGVTVAAWISLEGDVPDTEYGTAISRQIGDSIDQYYHLSVNSAERPALFVAMDELPSLNAFVAGDSAVKRSTFTHIAGTYDGSVARLYVDGEQKASDEIKGLFKSDTTPLILGANGNGLMVSERFPGRIDEIVLYNRNLDSQEIAQVANGGLRTYAATHPPGSTADGGALDR